MLACMMINLARATEGPIQSFETLRSSIRSLRKESPHDDPQKNPNFYLIFVKLNPKSEDYLQTILLL